MLMRRDLPCVDINIREIKTNPGLIGRVTWFNIRVLDPGVALAFVPRGG